MAVPSPFSLFVWRPDAAQPRSYAAYAEIPLSSVVRSADETEHGAPVALIAPWTFSLPGGSLFAYAGTFGLAALASPARPAEDVEVVECPVGPPDGGASVQVTGTTVTLALTAALSAGAWTASLPAPATGGALYVTSGTAEFVPDAGVVFRLDFEIPPVPTRPPRAPAPVSPAPDA